MPRSRRVSDSLSKLAALVSLTVALPALAGFMFLEPDPDPDPDPDPTPDPDPDPDPPLGPQGERALAAMKRETKELKSKLQAKEQELARLADEKKTAEERAVDQARLEGKQLAETETQPRLTALELENAILRHVGAKFADPDDAVMNLSTDSMRVEVLDDGKVDVDKLTKAADALLAKKPHLAAGATPAKGPTARPHQGAGGNGDGKPDPTQLERMKAAVEARTGIK